MILCHYPIIIILYIITNMVCVCASVRSSGILLARTQGNGYNSVSSILLAGTQGNGYNSMSSILLAGTQGNGYNSEFDILLVGTQDNGYNSVSRVSLSVMGITQCLVCLWGNQGPLVSWVNSWVGCENSQWEEKSFRVSVSFSVRVSLSIMGIFLGVSVMGITQCNGYPLGCVRV
jgi:hypothetical protein